MTKLPSPDVDCMPFSPPRKRCAALALGLLGFTALATGEQVFTKMANDGRALAANAALGPAPQDWACLRDKTTGLVWEVKTRDGGPRDRRWRFTPYDDNPATNGGYLGYRDTSSGKCTREKMPGGSCNTQAYVGLVNAQGLCGHREWRLPTVAEMTTVAPSTAATAPEQSSEVLLANVAEGWYWTGTLRSGAVAFARVVLLPPAASPSFYDGSYHVILVNGSPRSAERDVEARLPTPIVRVPHATARD